MKLPYIPAYVWEQGIEFKWMYQKNLINSWQRNGFYCIYEMRKLLQLKHDAEDVTVQCKSVVRSTHVILSWKYMTCSHMYLMGNLKHLNLFVQIRRFSQVATV